MFLQRLFNLLLIPLPFVPKTIHFLVNLTGVVVANEVIQLFHIFFSLKV